MLELSQYRSIYRVVVPSFLVRRLSVRKAVSPECEVSARNHRLVFREVVIATKLVKLPSLKWRNVALLANSANTPKPHLYQFCDRRPVVCGPPAISAFPDEASVALPTRTVAPVACVGIFQCMRSANNCLAGTYPDGLRVNAKRCSAGRIPVGGVELCSNCTRAHCARSRMARLQRSRTGTSPGGGTEDYDLGSPFMLKIASRRSLDVVVHRLSTLRTRSR